MKNIYLLTILFLSSVFSIYANAAPEGIAVIDYRTVFLGTDLAREKFPTEGAASKIISKN